MKRFALSILLFLSVVGVVWATILINEDFEGIGTPSGWVGTANFDYAIAPLAGLQSLRVPVGTLGYYDVGGAINAPEIWFRILFKAETITSNNFFQAEIFDSGYTPLYGANLDNDGTLSLAGTGNTVDSLSAGTIYNIWGHYKKGSGSNAVIELSFDVAGNPRPNSGNKFISITNGAMVANAAGIAFRLDLGGSDVFVVDNVEVCDTDCFAGGPTPTSTPTNTPTPTPIATATFTPTPTVTPTPSGNNWMLFFPH